jgi:hypothetical protein
MTTVNKAKAFKALDTFASSRVKLIESMQAAGLDTVEACKPVVIEWACVKTGAAFNVSKGGKVMLDSSHAKYEAAKTTVRDVMLMLQGTTRHATQSSNKTDPVEAVIKAMLKLTPAQRAAVIKAIA